MKYIVRPTDTKDYHRPEVYPIELCIIKTTGRGLKKREACVGYVRVETKDVADKVIRDLEKRID